VVEELVDDLDVDEVTVAATMHEQPELNFEGDALQAARKVGKPVVAVWIDARYGTQNEDAEATWFRRAFKQLSPLLCFELALDSAEW
jgi:hypothetical protein